MTSSRAALTPINTFFQVFIAELSGPFFRNLRLASFLASREPPGCGYRTAKTHPDCARIVTFKRGGKFPSFGETGLSLRRFGRNFGRDPRRNSLYRAKCPARAPVEVSSRPGARAARRGFLRALEPGLGARKSFSDRPLPLALLYPINIELGN